MMRAGTRLAALATASVVAVVAPAAATPPHPTHPTHPSRPSMSHKCAGHNVAYVASGRFVSWAATQNGNGTWSGTITVHVTRSNHHAALATGSDVTYALSSAKVTFGNGANPPVTADPVQVIGKISELGKKCTQSGVAPTITVRKVNIHATKR